MPTSSWRALPGSSGQTCTAQARSLHPRGLLCRRARTVCVQPKAAYNDGRKIQIDLSKTAVLAAGILSCLLTAHPAHAQQKIWRPRRHHRRIGERYGYNWADPIVAVRYHGPTAVPVGSLTLLDPHACPLPTHVHSQQLQRSVHFFVSRCHL
jgi:hypothetical protein